MPVGRISHWHLLCSKNTGESHLESSQCLRITLGIFSKFLRIVITHAEKASIVCDDLFQILLQERHGRLAPVNFVMTVDDPFFHQGLQSVDQGDNLSVRTQCFNFSGGKRGCDLFSFLIQGSYSGNVPIASPCGIVQLGKHLIDIIVKSGQFHGNAECR